LGLIGVERGKLKEEEIDKVIEELGLRALKKFEIEVKTKRGWICFLVVDVLGFTERAASFIASKYSVTALESGEHLILGEVSAKLWNEAVKIVFPDGDEEVIITVIHDGFLNARIPSDNVKGLKGVAYFNSHPVSLPIQLDDFVLLTRLNPKALDKITKLVQAYGSEKILSNEVVEYIRKLRKAEEEVQVSVDYETGFVLMRKGARITTVPIPEYVIRLAKDDKVEEAIKVYKDAPPQVKEEIVKALSEERDILKALNREEDYQKLNSILKKLEAESNRSNSPP